MIRRLSHARGEAPAKTFLLHLSTGKTSGRLGRSSMCGDYRLHPAPCGDFRSIPARDMRGMKRSRRSLCQIHLAICRNFTGATGLEPATSGVTDRFEGRKVDDEGFRLALFMR